jgi:hypothetical protein
LSSKVSGTLLIKDQSPTLGAHTHAHAHAHAHPTPWVLGEHGCDVIVHGWVWVDMGVIFLFMGGHGWALVLCIHASNSKLESNFSEQGIR